MKRNRTPLGLLRRFGLPTDWAGARILLSSPIVRTAAMLPLIGYLIVFSSAIENWLDFGALGSSFLLPQEIKLRLVYYGGGLVILAYCIYQVRCPALLKRYRNQEELAQATEKLGVATELREIGAREFEAAITSLKNDGATYSDYVLGAYVQYCKAMLEGSQTSYEDAVSHMMGERLEARRTITRNSLKTPNALSEFFDDYLCRMRLALHSGCEFKDSVENIVFAHEIVRSKALLEGLNGAAKDRAYLLYRYRYFQERVEHALSARCCISAAALGLLFICVPAIETFFQVIHLDLLRVSQGLISISN